VLLDLFWQGMEIPESINKKRGYLNCKVGEKRRERRGIVRRGGGKYRILGRGAQVFRERKKELGGVGGGGMGGGVGGGIGQRAFRSGDRREGS